MWASQVDDSFLDPGSQDMDDLSEVSRVYERGPKMCKDRRQ